MIQDLARGSGARLGVSKAGAVEGRSGLELIFRPLEVAVQVRLVLEQAHEVEGEGLVCHRHLVPSHQARENRLRKVLMMMNKVDGLGYKTAIKSVEEHSFTREVAGGP